MKKLIVLSILFLILSSCGKAPTPIIVTSVVTEQVEITQLATVEVSVEVSVEVTRIVIVTATYSGPTDTPTITATHSPSPTPKPTIDKTKADKTDGSYMVGSEIAPGIWRSRGGEADEECWITVKTYGGDLKAIAGDLPGGTIRIPSGEYIVYIGGGSGNKCTWSLLKP
jgi:hypothetical protein